MPFYRQEEEDLKGNGFYSKAKLRRVQDAGRSTLIDIGMPIYLCQGTIKQACSKYRLFPIRHGIYTGQAERCSGIFFSFGTLLVRFFFFLPKVFYSMLYTSKGSRIVKTRAIEAANVELLLHLQIAKKFDVSRLFEKRINFPELFNTYTSIFVIHHTYRYFVCLINKMLYQNHICSSSMLYGTAGEGRGQKSKYTVLPRGGRVQFDF